VEGENLEKREVFFRSINPVDNLPKDCVAIVVTHLVEDARVFLKIVGESFTKLVIIPKHSSKTNASIDDYSKYGLLIDVSRYQIDADPTNFFNVLDSHIKNNKFIIFDMGGYFSSQTAYLNERKNRFFGLIEDTENGHLRYEKALRGFNKPMFPIISVARSTLKDPEDILVGQAIAFSIEKILRSRLEILVGKTVLVIGYGKIGSGICGALKGRGAHIYFFDDDPIKTVKGLASGVQTGTRNSLIKNADLIVSATGNKALSKKDLENSKSKVYLFSATSSDDEFDSCLLECFDKDFSDSNIQRSKYSLKGKVAYLCNKGNSVNFIDGAVVDRYIELVQAEMIYAASIISNKELGVINQIKNEEKKFIAKKWLDNYFLKF
jgi:adenosylhomocysteinase